MHVAGREIETRRKALGQFVQVVHGHVPPRHDLGSGAVVLHFIAGESSGLTVRISGRIGPNEPGAGRLHRGDQAIQIIFILFQRHRHLSRHFVTMA